MYSEANQMIRSVANEGWPLMFVCFVSFLFFFFFFFFWQVDGRLMELVGDGSMFDENFERKVVDNEHIVLRVLPSQSRPLSVCDFKSMVK